MQAFTKHKELLQNTQKKIHEEVSYLTHFNINVGVNIIYKIY